MVVLPARPGRCPVAAPGAWLDLAGITDPDAPAFQGVTKANKPTGRPLNPESVNRLVQTAITRPGLDATRCSAHSLGAGFVTYAHLRGASDRAIAYQTHQRSLATIGTYVRVESAWTDDSATTLNL